MAAFDLFNRNAISVNGSYTGRSTLSCTYLDKKSTDDCAEYQAHGAYRPLVGRESVEANPWPKLAARLTTKQINHDPARTLMNCGTQIVRMSLQEDRGFQGASIVA